MLLAAQNMMYGSSSIAWKVEGDNPEAYFDFDHLVNLAEWAEKGKFHSIFITDHAAVREDLTTYEGTTLREHLGVPYQYERENNQ